MDVDNRPLSVMLVISSLEYGGAERQVIELVKNFDRSKIDPIICSLSHEVPLAEHLPDIERDLIIVEKKGRFDASTVARLAAVMRERRVDIAHAFLFDAEIATRLAARRAKVPVVIASERNTDYARPLVQTIFQWVTRSMYDVMIANSNAGKRFNMRTLKLADEKVRVVHNGIDIDLFRPDKEARAKIRAELGLKNSEPVVGMVASFKRQKRHQDFFKMASKVLESHPNAWFLLAGEPLRDNQQGAADYHQEVRSVLSALGIEPRCHFLGNRDDMRDVYNACDVTVLTSSREGTPNVLLESMACEVPVVATNIADNAEIVREGETGFVVPLAQPDVMAERVSWLLSDLDECQHYGEVARKWVCESFSTAALVRNTEDIYVSLFSNKLD